MATEWSAEGGTNGVTLTNANTGGASGTAWGMSVPAGTNAVFTSATKMHGSLGVAFSRASGTSAVYGLRTLSSPVARLALRGYVHFPTIPPAVKCGILELRNGSGSLAGFLEVSTAGKLSMMSAAGLTIATMTNAFTASTWYRWELGIAPGTSSTTGAYELAFYAGDSATPVETPKTSTNVNLGNVNSIGSFRWGLRQESFIGTVNMDDPAYDPLPSGFIGPLSATPPVAHAVGTKSYVVDLRTSAAGAGGDITFLTPTRISGPSLTVLQLTDGVFQFTTSDAGSSVYSFGISEAGGGTDSIEHTIPADKPAYHPKFFTGVAGIPSQSWS